MEEKDFEEIPQAHPPLLKSDIIGGRLESLEKPDKTAAQPATDAAVPLYFDPPPRLPKRDPRS
ncbi:hypothetical protein [Frondihabitans sp. PhB188]|uniref:hypothetical protein n=1 Tax=Frondihabitans sp. PhB188 TaxID=2485200 RepID=UPI0011CDE285|nr:hypothetical protein [Frondihabitans sp. PhB188]